MLQLTAGTDIEETEQGRIVQTNHGPMMLVPLSGTPPPVSVSDNIAGPSDCPSHTTLSRSPLTAHSLTATLLLLD